MDTAAQVRAPADGARSVTEIPVPRFLNSRFRYNPPSWCHPTFNDNPPTALCRVAPPLQPPRAAPCLFAHPAPIRVAPPAPCRVAPAPQLHPPRADPCRLNVLFAFPTWRRSFLRKPLTWLEKTPLKNVVNSKTKISIEDPHEIHTATLRS